MSILIDPSGKILTRESVVNQFLSPVQVGGFVVSQATRMFLQNELDENNVHELFSSISKEMTSFCQEKKLLPTRDSIFAAKGKEAALKRSEASQTPHINEGEEVHFFFDGNHIIYFNISNTHYSLIV